MENSVAITVGLSVYFVRSFPDTLLKQGQYRATVLQLVRDKVVLAFEDGTVGWMPEYDFLRLARADQ